MRLLKKGVIIFLIFISFFGCLKEDKEKKETNSPTPPKLKTILVNDSSDLEVLENDQLKVYIEGESSDGGAVYITLSEDWKEDETKDGLYIYQGETNAEIDIILEINLDDGESQSVVKREIKVKEDISEEEIVNDLTFLIYMAADNDLGMNPENGKVYHNYSKMDLEEIEQANIGDNLNVVIYGDFFEDKEPGIYVKEGNNLVYKKSLGNFNTGDPENLKDAINYVKQNYPSSTYVLDIWNHGTGWYDDDNKSRPQKAIAYDENSENDSLNLWEIEYAIENSNIPYLDVIYMDACLMAGVEVAYQLKDVGNYLVSSPELTPGQGGDYIEILENVSNKIGNISDKGVAIEIARSHVNSYREGGRQYIWGNESYAYYGLMDIIYSVIDLSKSDEMLIAFDEVVTRLDNISDINEDNILQYNYGNENYYDILAILKEFKTDGVFQTDELTMKINSFIEFIETEYVIYKEYQNFDSDEDGVIEEGYENLSQSSGLSIFYSSSYSWLTNQYKGASSFGVESQWSNLLPKY
ncbi:MAG: clostripain-related cysteine peptidase [Fusobacteriota bacterium]